MHSTISSAGCAFTLLLLCSSTALAYPGREATTGNYTYPPRGYAGKVPVQGYSTRRPIPGNAALASSTVAVHTQPVAAAMPVSVPSASAPTPAQQAAALSPASGYTPESAPGARRAPALQAPYYPVESAVSRPAYVPPGGHPHYVQDYTFRRTRPGDSEKNPFASMVALDARLGGGYRTDDFRWNIAGDINGQNPNILSELKWTDIESYVLDAELRLRLRDGWLRGLYLEANGQTTTTFSGKNQDSDYLLDDRQAEFSRSDNNSENGWMQSAGASVGYSFQGSRDDGVWHYLITPFVGYTYAQQHFTQTDLYQTIPAVGPIAGLHSAYDTTWRGPHVGLDYDVLLYELHHFRLRGSYFKGDYRGIGNWNLRADFAHPRSFDHTADATGWSARLWYGYMVLPSLELYASAQLDQMETDSGVDRTYFSDGTSADTRLNKARWMGQSYTAGVSYNF